MKNKKGFTLIEFIVTIAILGILVLLASLRFFGYTQNAERTKGFANARTIEKASELYYMDHEDWPRLTDEPYTSEEIESYSERIFDNTGQEVNLDPEGNYYDIDYDKLSDYVKVPDDKKNYILQSPVGKVFYMENLNETGIARVNYSNVEEENDNPTPIGGLTNSVVSREPTAEEIAINSADELAKIGEDKDYPLTGKYILTSDIDLSGFDNWVPIGSHFNSKFTGSFDGNGYSITGLTIDKPEIDYIGLFGYTYGATIENVALENIDITGKDSTGGLVGYANSSTRITNSYATGSVLGTGDNTGGLVGYATNSTIENSYATGAVTGTGDTGDTGGLVGYADSSTRITNSYATGTVSGTGYNTGGLVGHAYSSSIENSYATGSVTSTSWTGGLVGHAYSSSIENSYATGSVTSTGDDVGGLVGQADNATITNSYATGTVTGGSYTGGLVGEAYESSVTNSYWDKDTTGQSTSAGGEGKTTDDMKMKETYIDWNFKDIWQINKDSYPTLKNIAN